MLRIVADMHTLFLIHVNSHPNNVSFRNVWKVPLRGNAVFRLFGLRTRHRIALGRKSGALLRRAGSLLLFQNAIKCKNSKRIETHSARRDG